MCTSFLDRFPTSCHHIFCSIFDPFPMKYDAVIYGQPFRENSKKQTRPTHHHWCWPLMVKHYEQDTKLLFKNHDAFLKIKHVKIWLYIVKGLIYVYAVLMIYNTKRFHNFWAKFGIAGHSGKANKYRVARPTVLLGVCNPQNWGSNLDLPLHWMQH